MKWISNLFEGPFSHEGFERLIFHVWRETFMESFNEYEKLSVMAGIIILQELSME